VETHKLPILKKRMVYGPYEKRTESRCPADDQDDGWNRVKSSYCSVGIKGYPWEVSRVCFKE
jgi:hypothetical protein